MPLDAGEQIAITIGFRDVREARNFPDWQAGDTGHLCHKLDAARVRAGRFKAHLAFTFPPNFRYPVDVDTVLRIHDHPVQARLERLK